MIGNIVVVRDTLIRVFEVREELLESVVEDERAGGETDEQMSSFAAEEVGEVRPQLLIAPGSHGIAWP